MLRTTDEDVDVTDVNDMGPNVIDDSHRKCGGVKDTFGPQPSSTSHLYILQLFTLIYINEIRQLHSQINKELYCT